MKPSELEIKLAILCTYAIVAAIIAAIIFFVHRSEKRRMWRKDQERRVKEHAWNIANEQSKIVNEQKRIIREQKAEEQAIQNRQRQNAYAEQQRQAVERARSAAELLAAQQQAEDAAKEAELLPRINDAFRILQETSNFTLLLKCLVTGACYLHRTTLEKLLNENRAVIIDAAVTMASTTDAAAMHSAVQQLLTGLKCSNYLPLLLLDIEREILSQSSQTGFEKRLQAICKAKENRIRIINASPTADLDKERLVEEIESEFSERLSQIIADDSKSKAER